MASGRWQVTGAGAPVEVAPIPVVELLVTDGALDTQPGELVRPGG